ncbi:hypothetical protein H5P28_08685 [Ruficoccus amylovorans]|uniref:16S/18S rRNA aminocarboxypropyltransferase Tsr3 C-terminal domain-containing protein n=1 Tax=Ruficoccus amylovorans TaxID=1804625 RepID=A0A842HFI8_9BACT|nr:hypothetical protein [Ruficoccus amylovorans]MBC2594337.1 hypothetical protein [Ruficoccus amylovorans]
MIPTVVIRHPKERLSKCSLEPLRGRPDLVFIKAKPGLRFDASGFVLLHTGGGVLCPADAVPNEEEKACAAQRAMTACSLGPLPACFGEGKVRPFLLLDSTWRLLPQLEACLTGNPLPRRLPDGVRTAYPRVSKLAPEPSGGLASVEALYLARRLLGDNDPSLLANYHWREEFLARLVDFPGI